MIAIGRFVGPILLSAFLMLAVLSCGSPAPSFLQGDGQRTPSDSGGVSAQGVQPQGSSPTTGPSLATREFATAISQVAGQVKPAVVQITSSQISPDFFSQAIPQTGVGSGVIYDRDGHILTNNHVVAGADKLTVALPDGRSFDGKLIGRDPETDLAVVQIQGSDLPVAQLGDSSKLAVGDWVVAIGNALALPGGPTVTAGVVSALGRSVQEPGDQQTGAAGPFLYDLIQTDAAINPGNSGGALVNLDGQVVGINTLVAGMAEPGVQAQGIGFAIAINSAKPVAEQLVATGKVVHPFMGIRYTSLTPSLARQLGIQDGTGAVIAQVVPGSPAATAGLQRLDVIRKIENQPIVDESTLGRVLSTKKPGDTVTLTVQRGQRTMEVKVTLGERPAGA